MDGISFATVPLSAKVVVLDKNRLVSTMRQISPLWDLLFRTLKPTDIVSLAIATNFRIQPTKRQKQIYMKWWRQIFYNMKWVEQNERRVTIIGKDLAKFKDAMQKWYYFNTKELKLLAVVGRTPTAELRTNQEFFRDVDLEKDQGQIAITESIDVDISYCWANTHEIMDCQTQICIIFRPKSHKFVDLYDFSAQRLLQPIRGRAPIQHQGVAHHLNTNEAFSPLSIIITPPGTQRIILTGPANPWFKTWYSNLQHLDCGIEPSITRIDFIIDDNQPLGLPFNIDNIARLSITEDGSLIIPAISERFRGQLLRLGPDWLRESFIEFYLF
jgi:hypothetical protein